MKKRKKEEKIKEEREERGTCGRSFGKSTVVGSCSRQA
jgi:hypothetical protein